jgi:nucleotide-binding universal stress UspA family protein
MFSKLLLAIDGSKGSQLAVHAAQALATATGAEVAVLHVLEQPWDGASRPEDEPPAGAVRLVDDVVAQLGQEGVSAQHSIEQAPAGEIGRVIVDVARAGHADTIVIGSRGLTEAKAMLLGSVAHDVIQQFHGCVLVAR